MTQANTQTAKPSRPLKILLVGGGSGGHLTPLFAVRDAVLKQTPGARTEIWTDRKMLGAAEARATGTRIRIITSGKYRRYVGKKTPLKDRLSNFIDLFRIALGVVQSFFRLLFSRPDVIFLKGGFASVPAGFAAHVLGVPYVIHESDSDLGLANRLLAKHAKVIATGLPSSASSEPLGSSRRSRGAASPTPRGLSAPQNASPKTVYTGIPIDEAWLGAVSQAAKTLGARQRESETATTHGDGLVERRAETPVSRPEQPSVVILGGGLGAHSLNLEAAKMAKYFGTQASAKAGQPKITAFIGASESKELESELQGLGVETHRFVSNAADLVQIVQNADVVVARAGATTIAELAAASRPVILVAKATLPGGHQEKNAAILAKQGAVIDYDGSTLDQDQLPKAVADLLANPAKRQALGAKLHELGRYDAADALAGILLNLAKTKTDPQPQTGNPA